jgi:hypothetical protein
MFGTYRTCRAKLTMSVDGGKAWDGGRYQIEMTVNPCKAPTTRLAVKPNRNEPVNPVERLRYAAFASVACMEPGVAHRRASVTETIGTARALRRRCKQ